MADPIVRKLKADMTRAEAEVRKWQEIVEGFRKTLLYYERDAATETVGSPASTRTRSTPGRALNDAMYEIMKSRGQAVYYKDLYEDLKERGIEVPGQDPTANVVAHLSGDDRFENVGRGMWYLTRSVASPTPAPGGPDLLVEGPPEDDEEHDGNEAKHDEEQPHGLALAS